MNIGALIKQKIIDSILNSFNPKWAVLIYDRQIAGIIENLFKKTDFIKYNIIASHHIEELRSSLEYPAIYLIAGDKDGTKLINDEMKNMKYLDCKVFSLYQPVGLNQSIPYTIINLNIKVLEERIFTCNHRDLPCFITILESKFNINYSSGTDIAVTIMNNANNDQGRSFNKWNTILLLERRIDMFTPLLHFFTFKSVLHDNLTAENGREDGKYMESLQEDGGDPIYPIIRYQHLAEINKTLNSHVKKLNRDMEKLNTGKVDTSELELMALNAPKNMKIKKALEKYSKLFNECLKKVENIKELVEMEQALATGYDKNREKLRLCMDAYFSEFKNGRYTLEEKQRLLYMIKLRGYRFTNTEKEILKNCRIPVKDIECELDLRWNILRNEKGDSKYVISRYVPILYDVVRNYLKSSVADVKARESEGSAALNSGSIPNIFRRVGESSKEVVSLRKSRMMTVDRKQDRRLILVYVQGGITVEEMRVPYILSEEFGVEIILGSDCVLTASEYMGMLRGDK